MPKLFVPNKRPRKMTLLGVFIFCISVTSLYGLVAVITWSLIKKLNW